MEFSIAQPASRVFEPMSGDLMQVTLNLFDSANINFMMPVEMASDIDIWFHEFTEYSICIVITILFMEDLLGYRPADPVRAYQVFQKIGELTGHPSRSLIMRSPLLSAAHAIATLLFGDTKLGPNCVGYLKRSVEEYEEQVTKGNFWGLF